MRTLFKPVFGWRGGDSAGLEPFVHTGADGSWLAGAVCAAGVVPARGVVLLCHPFLKYGMHWFFNHGYHEWLADAGYHVVGFDFKGFGRSTVGGVSFAEDVVALGEWVRAALAGLPVHVLGDVVRRVPRAPRHRDGPYSVRVGPVRQRAGHGRALLRQRRDGRRDARLSTSRWADVTGTRAIFRSLPLPDGLPRLLLFGAADPFITPAEMDRLRDACGAGNVRVYPGCGHLEVRKAFPVRTAAPSSPSSTAHPFIQHSTKVIIHGNERSREKMGTRHGRHARHRPRPGRGLLRGRLDVVFTYQRSHDAAAQLVHEMKATGAHAAGHCCDSADEQAVNALARNLLGGTGAPHAVINNVGITRDGVLMRMSGHSGRTSSTPT